MLAHLREKRDDLIGAFDEEVTVAPDAVGRVALGDTFGVLGIPHRLCEFEFLVRCFCCERGFY